MLAIKVEVTKFVSDDFPGFVECKFTDIWNDEYVIEEKVSVVSDKDLDVNSEYPREGIITCEILKEWVDRIGRKIVTVDIGNVYDIKTVKGSTEFDLFKNQLIVNYERGDNM